MMLKNCLYLCLACFFIIGCGHTNNLFQSKPVANSSHAKPSERAFLNDIKIAPFEVANSKPATKLPAPYKVANRAQPITSPLLNNGPTSVEAFLPVQFKFAILLDATVEKIVNTSLYNAIDIWMGTRYRYGGTTHKGIDCSAFVQKVSEAFGWFLPRTAHEQHSMMQAISKEDLREGDFVFFHTHRGYISHVGMYLHNNKFVHASTSKGVIISDLNDAYWGDRFVAAGRMVLDSLTASIHP